MDELTEDWRDLDVFIEASEKNAARLHAVLVDFGFGEAAPDESVLAQEGKAPRQLADGPRRSEVLASLDGHRARARGLGPRRENT